MDHGGEVEMRLRLVAARYVHKASGGRQFYKKVMFLTAMGLLPSGCSRSAQPSMLIQKISRKTAKLKQLSKNPPMNPKSSRKIQKPPPERPKNAANLAAWQNYARALGQDPGKRTKDQLMTELP